MIEGKIAAYIDTCVWIDLMDGLHPAFRDILATDQVKAVYSDVTLSDLVGSTTLGERLRFIDELGAWYVTEAEDQQFALVAKKWSANDRLAEMHRNDLAGVGEFETALHQLMSDLSRKGTGQSLSGILAKTMKSSLPLLRQIQDEAGTQGVVFAPVSQVEQLAAEAEAMDGQTVDEFLREIQSTSGGALAIGGLRPPNIVAKILDQLDQEDLRHEFDATRMTFDSLTQAAIVLGMLGYARDRGIAKSNEAKSLRGSRKEMRDGQHIALATCCGLFVTSDKRAAKKFFALSEYYKSGAGVVFLTLDGKATFVNEKNWPFD